MTTENILRVKTLIGEDYFDYEFHKGEAHAAMLERASERGLTVNESDIRYLGESEPTEDWAKGKGIVCHTFEAEAVEGVEA